MDNEDAVSESESNETRTKTPRQLDFLVAEVDAEGKVSMFQRQPPPQITFADLENWMSANVIKDKAVIRTYIKHREVVVHKEVVTTTTFRSVKKK
jgi:hypothetical protein